MSPTSRVARGTVLTSPSTTRCPVTPPKARTSPAAPYQLLPLLADQAFDDLKRDIAARGVLVPIVRDEDGALLDGHHRVRAIAELRHEGVRVADPPVLLRVGMTETEKRAFVRAINLHRRHLTASQRRAIVEEQLAETPDQSDRAIASLLAISPTTVGTIRRRLGEKGATVQNGHRIGLDGRRQRLPRTRTILAASEGEARRAMAAVKAVGTAALPNRMLSAQELNAAARIAQRETNREARFADLAEAPVLPSGRRFSVLYVDPPWRYEGGGGPSDPTRQAERHYPTMAHEELLLLPVGALAAKDAIIFLWATPPKLAEAIELLVAWGFEFRTSACWIKEQPASAASRKRGDLNPRDAIGMGSYFRQAHELLLVGIRGRIPPPAPADRPSSILRAPRGPHSAKPAIARETIQRMYPSLPRIELFARGKSKGWTSWGHEAAE